MDTILIEQLEVFASHGVLPEENILGQKFLVSCELFLDTEEAGIRDDLALSVHYGQVCACLSRALSERTFQLIEAAAQHAAREVLLSFPRIDHLRLTLKKPWAPVKMSLESVGVSIERGWHRAVIALGSNLGDKKGYLSMALAALEEDPDFRKISVSSFHSTKPYGGVAQDDFLNAVLTSDTLLSPRALLKRLQGIEQKAGRTREIHWGPRTLDLDILFYDDLVMDSPSLTIPHPDLANRDFVLTPALELIPFYRHPLLHKRISELHKELFDRSGK